MLQTTRGERFAARLGVTLFDLLVYITVFVLVVFIGFTAAFGLTDVREKVIFLQMDERNVYELWIADPDDPAGAQPITRTEAGVWDFDVSADGRYVVYSMMDYSVGARDIFILNLQTGESIPITACAEGDADCYAPRFHPDGRLIAYERATMGSGAAFGIGAPRIWLIDLDLAQTAPLVEDAGGMVLGTDAVWSDDGSHLAFYDNSAANIVVYRLADQSLRVIQSGMGISGALSPDGAYLIYPEISINRGFLRLFETETNLIRDITDPGELADEQYAAWSPNGRYVAIGRRAGDGRGTQIYLLDIWNFNVTPLLIDRQYNHSAFRWNAESNMLVMTRFRLLNDDGSLATDSTQEAWVYNVETRRLIRLSEPGQFVLNPQWITPPRRIATP